MKTPGTRATETREMGDLVVTVVQFTPHWFEAFCQQFPDETGWGSEPGRAIGCLLVTLTEKGLIDELGQESRV